MKPFLVSEYQDRLKDIRHINKTIEGYESRLNEARKYLKLKFDVLDMIEKQLDNLDPKWREKYHEQI